MRLLIKASSELWPQLKAQLGKRPQPSLLQKGQFPGEDEMCQLVEAKQEPSFVSNTFFKQVKGSWVETVLKGISLSLKEAKSQGLLHLSTQSCVPMLPQRFALAKGRQRPWQSPGAWGSGPTPTACLHAAYIVTAEPHGRCPQ